MTIGRTQLGLKKISPIGLVLIIGMGSIKVGIIIEEVIGYVSRGTFLTVSHARIEHLLHFKFRGLITVVSHPALVRFSALRLEN